MEIPRKTMNSGIFYVNLPSIFHCYNAQNIFIIQSCSMALTIAIPSNPAYSSITANTESVCRERGFVFNSMSEFDCAQSLYHGTADIALIDPLNFARNPSELRIIPSTALSAEGFSNLASIHFMPGREDIKVMALEEDVFLFQIGALCLSEKFDVFPEIVIDSAIINSSQAINPSYDGLMYWNHSFRGEGMLDIVEEWSDIQTSPLPLMFWACKDEDMPDPIELTTLFAADDLPKSDEMISSALGSEADPRTGTIHFDFSDAFIASLESIQHFMFYHRMIEAVRATTLLGN